MTAYLFPVRDDGEAFFVPSVDQHPRLKRQIEVLKSAEPGCFARLSAVSLEFSVSGKETLWVTGALWLR